MEKLVLNDTEIKQLNRYTMCIVSADIYYSFAFLRFQNAYLQTIWLGILVLVPIAFGLFYRMRGLVLGPLLAIIIPLISAIFGMLIIGSTHPIVAVPILFFSLAFFFLSSLIGNFLALKFLRDKGLMSNRVIIKTLFIFAAIALAIFVIGILFFNELAEEINKFTPIMPIFIVMLIQLFLLPILYSCCKALKKQSSQ